MREMFIIACLNCLSLRGYKEINSGLSVMQILGDVESVGEKGGGCGKSRGERTNNYYTPVIV